MLTDKPQTAVRTIDTKVYVVKKFLKNLNHHVNEARVLIAGARKQAKAFDALVEAAGEFETNSKKFLEVPSFVK